MRALFTLLILLAGAATAEERMSGAEFEAYTQGKTLSFGNAGQTYGAEEYLEGRRVRWSFLDGKCLNGIWYEQADAICFVYEDAPEPHCWSFYRRPDGLTARFEGDQESGNFYQAAPQSKPLFCLGPEVGV